MIEHGFFYLAVTLLLLHEMDAIRCREWRIFPGLSLLENHTGFVVFMVAHVPLYLLLFWGLMDPADNRGVMRGVDVFGIVHLGLHLLFRMHPKNEFKDVISWGIIAGAAIAGFTDLLLKS